ncbi:MAG: IS5 family transposase [Candidatus Binataceae bacterium]
MRGEERPQRSMLMVMNVEGRIPQEHPLRGVKRLAEAVLKELSPIFDSMYSATGRPSIPPERLLKASLLMALYTVRSERLFCEQLDYNLSFRWFLDLELDEASFDHSSFSTNRARLLEHEVAGEFFRGVVGQARALKLLSDEHFTVDGTLVEAWASLKSFKRKGEGPGQPPDDTGNPTVNFHGESRSNQTHQSTTDPEALQARKGKGKEAKLCYSANALMENRHALLVDFQVEPADGTAERRAALAMVDERLAGSRRITLGGDKGYDTREFAADCRALKVTPHVAQNQGRRGGSAIGARTARHPGYAVSQRIRKRVEEVFGWMKTIGGLRKTRYRGRERVQMHAYLVAAAYNLLRIARLVSASP